MFCNRCGEEIDDGSRFCRHCGAAQPLGSVAAEPPASPAWSSPPSSERPVKPVNSTGRAIGIGAAALLGLLAVGSVINGFKSPEAAAAENSTDMLADNLEAQAGNMEAMAAGTAKQDVATTPDSSGPWAYSTDVDKVRGGTSYFASTNSTNSVRQDPPYDADTTMRITVRRMPSNGTDVVLTISSGQMMCPSYEGCSGTVRFDNGPAQRISFNGPADNSSDTIFVVGAKPFIAKLKKANKLIIEKTLYEAGEPQFEFDVSGLKWSH